MRQEIAAAIKDGMPCLAECGGFMYLHEKMEGMDGKCYEMAGVIPGKVWRTPRLTRFGYITLKQNLGISHGKQETAILGDSDLGVSPAHEFHYFVRIIVELHFMLPNRKANAGGTACTALIIC